MGKTKTLKPKKKSTINRSSLSNLARSKKKIMEERRIARQEKRMEERRRARKEKFNRQNYDMYRDIINQNKNQNRNQNKTFLDEFRELILHQSTKHQFFQSLSSNYRDNPSESDYDFFKGLAATPQLKFLSSISKKEIFNKYIQYIKPKENQKMGLGATISFNNEPIENIINRGKESGDADWIKIEMLMKYIDTNKIQLNNLISTMQENFKENYKSLQQPSSSSSTSSSSTKSLNGGKRKKKKTKRRKKKTKKRRKTRKKKRKKR